MATLVPVDHDPFGGSQQAAPARVYIGPGVDSQGQGQGQGGPKLVPVDHDPFAEAADHGLSERQKLSPVQKALNPITSYPETYERMNREAREQASKGIDQIANAEGAWDVAKGVGNTAVGALGYVASPINAAYRSVVGQPIEDVTGIPREYTEFAAQLATPGIGMVSAGKAAAPSVRAVEQAAPAADELLAAGKAGYKDQAFTDLTVKPTPIREFADTTALKLGQEGFDPVVAPKTHEILSRIQKVPEESVITGKNIHTIRKTLGKIAGSIDPQEKAAATQAIIELDALVPKLRGADVVNGDARAAARVLKDANANYSAGKTSQKIDAAIEKSERQAAASNSGKNVGNILRQQLHKIISNPKYRRGFNAEELDQMDRIIRGTADRNGARTASNVLGGGGGMGALASGAVGGVLAGPVGYLAPFAGQALRSWTNKATVEQVRRLGEAVRNRAPLASSLEKFEVAADQFSKGRNAKTFAATSIAARNLSHNLRGSGFNISPTEIMKSLQLGGPGRAEDQQEIVGPPGQ